MQILQPPNWVGPKGYSNGIVAEGRLIFLAGIVGWDEQNRFQSLDFVGQCRQALVNIVTLLREAGAKPEHIVRMTWYIIDKKEYLASARQLGLVYREIMGKHYPAMTAVQVQALMENQARLEIEVTAVLPN